MSVTGASKGEGNMEEKEFFRHDDVTVTNSRLIVGAQTFAMSNITSVKASQDSPNRTWPVVILVFGLIALFANSFGMAIMFGVIGGFWLALQKNYYHVALTTAGGETKALTSNQQQYIEEVVKALNEAIVHRG